MCFSHKYATFNHNEQTKCLLGDDNNTKVFFRSGIKIRFQAKPFHISISNQFLFYTRKINCIKCNRYLILILARRIHNSVRKIRPNDEMFTECCATFNVPFIRHK